ncbi:MAG: protease HtpX [Bdellovibrionaceae bacterium]|nr:protease HtpX [Pseudobdellovibrionaceae bacterium]
MQWIKRIGLFLTVNILVMVTISLVLNLLGVKPYITAQGLNFEALMVFCLVWGMGGAFISLGLSRIMAKWMMGVKVIPPDVQDPALRELLHTVHGLAQAARLPKMPEVGIYESPEVNAFATGPTKSRSLVAVSTGLLQRMNDEQVKGVLGHEVAHIANGDMVTMTLIQGVVNAFVMFLARVIAYGITMARGNDSEESQGSPLMFHLVTFVLEMVFMVLGSIVVAWFSRYREFRADAGGAKLAGRESMISALQGLQRTIDEVGTDQAQPAIASLKISSRGGFARLFSTHPPLEERIERLKTARI